jgi:branched-chain amino acid transport system ATP-binding protein
MFETNLPLGDPAALDPTLRVKALTAGYRGAEIIRGVSLTLEAGKIVGILGANGAGKSTLLRAIAGLCPVIRGNVSMGKKDLRRKNVARHVRSGVVLVPQGYALFGGLTVEENLAMGAWRVRGQEHVRRMDECYELFPLVHARRFQKVEALSGGERALLAIGRGLMARPRVLLLDEPSLGLSPRARHEVLAAIKVWCDSGRLSCIVAEQDVVNLGQVADYWHVIRGGEIVYSGIPGDRSLDELRDLYLGSKTTGDPSFHSPITRGPMTLVRDASL